LPSRPPRCSMVRTEHHHPSRRALPELGWRPVNDPDPAGRGLPVV
jgi:hypothetical protein